MDSCLVEIVQVEGVQMSESPAPPTDQHRSPDIEMHRKLNMYLIKFERPRKIAAPSTLNLDLFNKIRQASLMGLP